MQGPVNVLHPVSQRLANAIFRAARLHARAMALNLQARPAWLHAADNRIVSQALIARTSQCPGLGHGMDHASSIIQGGPNRRGALFQRRMANE
jgi:hypothetical protein